jgi:GNAT superfamily N-acetyltransferase
MQHVHIRPIAESDRSWLTDFWVNHWGSPQMVTSRGVHHGDQLPGFVAWEGEEPVGLLTYHADNGRMEIVSLDSLREGRGIGSALMQAVEEAALREGVRRLWLITTNDNLHALRFYQKRGYVLAALHANAVATARRIKPEIPLIGNDGIPIRDELELEKAWGAQA